MVWEDGGRKAPSYPIGGGLIVGSLRFREFLLTVPVVGKGWPNSAETSDFQ